MNIDSLTNPGRFTPHVPSVFGKTRALHFSHLLFCDMASPEPARQNRIGRRSIRTAFNPLR